MAVEAKLVPVSALCVDGDFVFDWSHSTSLQSGPLCPDIVATTHLIFGISLSFPDAFFSQYLQSSEKYNITASQLTAMLQNTMSYQQTSSPNTETTFPRSSSGAMYNPQSSRTHAPENQPRAASYTHNPGGGAQNDNVPMNNIMNQFAGLQLPSNAAAMAANQIPMHGQMFYTPDGQLVYAPNMYSAPSMPSVTEGAYSSYPGAMSYLPPAYHSYGVPNYPSVPYTPARAAPYYTGGSDHLTKDVPGLENRRGSYSTNESAPNTPYYGALAQRDHGTHIAPLDRSPFGSTPSPRDLALHAKVSKPLSYTSIPVGVDIQALLKQFPPIPPAVPAVFTPEENKRTLDQSLHNPIKGNRNVYIRGLHPNTNDETLALYATRFGKVETSKAIIDTATEACKG